MLTSTVNMNDEGTNIMHIMHHYYGDTVRKLFMAGGAVMLVSLPLMHGFVPYPVFASILAILVIDFAAGIVAPRKRWAIMFNFIVSALAFSTFEYHAVDAYINAQYSFFLANQSLAIIFFVAFYYSVKTLRGMLLEEEFPMGKTEEVGKDEEDLEREWGEEEEDEGKK